SIPSSTCTTKVETTSQSLSEEKYIDSKSNSVAGRTSTTPGISLICAGRSRSAPLIATINRGSRSGSGSARSPTARKNMAMERRARPTAMSNAVVRPRGRALGLSSRPAAPFIPDKLLMSVAGSRGSPGPEGQLTGLGDEQLEDAGPQLDRVHPPGRGRGGG